MFFLKEMPLVRLLIRRIKETVFVGDIFGDGGVIDDLPSWCDSAERIDEQFVEFYVISNDYSWTYIKTHEGDLCGPYFLKVEN